MLKRICVFCGSNTGSNPSYARAAQIVGGLLCERGVDLVYGGGRVGLMGTLADACLKGGGRVIGVIPKALAKPGDCAHRVDRIADRQFDA